LNESNKEENSMNVRVITAAALANAVLTTPTIARADSTDLVNYAPQPAPAEAPTKPERGSHRVHGRRRSTPVDGSLARVASRAVPALARRLFARRARSAQADGDRGSGPAHAPPIPMKRAHPGERVTSIPAYKRFAAAAYWSVRHKPTMHGLLEVDVTEPRAMLRAYRERTGERLSFTAFLVVCLAKAVDEHKSVQALRQGKRKLVVFDDVDVATRIEHEVDGEDYVVPYIVRAANHKTVRAVHDEIRSAQRSDARSELARLRFVPTALHRSFVRVFTAIAERRPRLWKETMGTVGITSVGMFAHGFGYGIPLPAPTALMLTVGGIGQKAVVREGRVVVREMLSLTITLDHNVVDGAPATRFAERLKQLIESGYGLDGLEIAEAARAEA
jgi:pyruvate/2-oxoglutarate dehydrogenase complex dihydrolipoamide acyltransferase (E2) component